MKTSDAGIYAIALHEGIVPGPYFDSKKVPTYGIGHTAAAGDPNPLHMPRGVPSDMDAALRDVFTVFRRDLAKYEAAVNKAVKVPLLQTQFDALVSFHFNTGAIARATLTKKLNAGDMAGAAAAFMSWNKPPEVIERRRAEHTLFKTGMYPGGKVTVWGVTESGRVIWKPLRQLNFEAVMKLMGRAPVKPAAEAAKTPAHTLKPATQADVAGPREHWLVSLWRAVLASFKGKGF